MSLRQENRTRAGLVNLGPGALEFAALMDRSGSTLLEKGLVALKGDIAGVTTQTPDAVLVDVPTPGSTILGPYVTAILSFEDLMTSHDQKSGCPCSMAETLDPKTETVMVAGNPGVIFTTLTVSADVSHGSIISIDVKIETLGDVKDATSGATIYRIESTGTGHIDGDACPDASGIAKAHIAFTAKENYFNAATASGGRNGYGLNQSYSADVRIKADDNANLAGIDIVAKAHEDSKGGVRAAGASQSDLNVYSLDTDGTQSVGYDPTSGFKEGITSDPTATSMDALRLAGGMVLYTELPAKSAAKVIETAWRSGRCIAVFASPGGGDVAKGSVTSVTVTVKQKFEGTELDKAVEAAFEGVRSLDPAGQKQPAPATFSYTAGSSNGDKGSVTFKSASNRGIGQTSVQFVAREPPKESIGLVNGHYSIDLAYVQPGHLTLPPGHYEGDAPIDCSRGDHWGADAVIFENSGKRATAVFSFTIITDPANWGVGVNFDTSGGGWTILSGSGYAPRLSSTVNDQVRPVTYTAVADDIYEHIAISVTCSGGV